MINLNIQKSMQKSRDSRAAYNICKDISKLSGFPTLTKVEDRTLCLFRGEFYLVENIMYFVYDGQLYCINLYTMDVKAATTPIAVKRDEWKAPEIREIVHYLLTIIIYAQGGKALKNNEIVAALSSLGIDARQFKFEVNFITKGLQITETGSDTLVDYETFLYKVTHDVAGKAE